MAAIGQFSPLGFATVDALLRHQIEACHDVHQIASASQPEAKSADIMFHSEVVQLKLNRVFTGLAGLSLRLTDGL
jgi:DNA-binding FadR family transcriptional regulator